MNLLELEAMSDAEIDELVLDLHRDGINKSLPEGHSVISIPYCDNASNSWPIIIENNISLIKLPDGYEAVVDWDYIDLGSHDRINDVCIGDNDVTCHGHKNPLRAAMIVFLLMKGEE